MTAISPFAEVDGKRLAALESVAHINDFQVIELRRYDIAPGQRDRFVNYFDSFFPEAFQQLGAIVFGQFLDRSSPTKFVWLRGYHEINARPTVAAGFYYGPVWREHRVKLNALFPGLSDNVLLLRPLNPGTSVPVLPAVDPFEEPEGAKGIAVIHIFAIKHGEECAFARKAEAAFLQYREAPVRPAGVLVTLDIPNNFPQLPIRTDGPFLVWLGIVQDASALARFKELASQSEESLGRTGMLRGVAELLVLDPTRRSRIRCWPMSESLKT